MREPYTGPGTLATSYFDRMYEKSHDPWGFATRWYERRKYSLTVAALPRPHYARAFEAGCSIGVLTAELAPRCGQLLAVDASADAVRQAAERTAHVSNVTVQQRRLPDEWPSGSFDLVVLSEIGYYFAAADLADVVKSCVASLTPGGTLLAAHWRHPVPDYPLRGDAVHDAIADHANLERTVSHEEEDFRLDVFQRVPPAAMSVAEAEGLLP